MEGAQAILDSSQDKYFSLCRKYDQAKRLIADLRQAESVLTEQLLTREEQYALHLVRLRERVVELEEELIGTQRSAGLPVRLPYDPELGRKLLSPPELLKRQPFLPVVRMPGELSDHEEEEVEEVSSSLDRAVPRTALLDCQGAKHRAELVHRSQGLATRHRPSGEGLRAGVLRREESSSSITSQPSSNTSTKNPIGLKVNVHSGIVPGPSRVTVSPARDTTERKSSNASNQPIQGSSPPQSKPSAAETNGSSPPQASSSQSSAAKPHPPTPHPKPPQAGKAPMSFLAEIQAAQKRRGLEESPEASPPQPKQTTQRPQASQGTSHNGGGGVASLQEQLRSRLEARKRSVEESETSLPEQHPEIRSSVQISSSKEPSEVGVIPPQFMSNSSLSSSMNSSYSKLDTHTSFSAAAHRSLSPERPQASTAHHWTNNPVEMWAKEQVGNWLLALNMEMYIPRFLDSNVTGEILLNLDSTQLKQLGVVSKNDREKIKEKIKELRKQNEKEKKEVEKERKKKEKAAKTAGSKAGKR